MRATDGGAHGHGRADRSGYADRPSGFLPLIGISGCLLAVAVSLVTRVVLSVLSAESVGDTLVGGIGLPVDAVRVDLQDREAVPGAAGDLGRRNP